MFLVSLFAGVWLGAWVVGTAGSLWWFVTIILSLLTTTIISGYYSHSLFCRVSLSFPRGCLRRRLSFAIEKKAVLGKESESPAFPSPTYIWSDLIPDLDQLR